MANKEQKGNREKRKPKAETVKGAPVTSTFSSAEAKAKAGQGGQGKKAPVIAVRSACLRPGGRGFKDGPPGWPAPQDHHALTRAVVRENHISENFETKMSVPLLRLAEAGFRNEWRPAVHSEIDRGTEGRTVHQDNPTRFSLVVGDPARNSLRLLGKYRLDSYNCFRHRPALRVARRRLRCEDTRDVLLR